mgnify:CR=1 FL=1
MFDQACLCWDAFLLSITAPDLLYMSLAVPRTDGQSYSLHTTLLSSVCGLKASSLCSVWLLLIWRRELVLVVEPHCT